MKIKIGMAAGLVALAASSVQAQDRRGIELGINLGYTGSSGIDSNEVAPSGEAPVFVEVRPKSTMSWGIDAGYFVKEKIQVGALFSNQKSELQYTVETTFKQVGEGLDVQNFMGTVAYHTGWSYSRTRFYVLGGLGATRYGEVTLVGADGLTVQTSGKSKFATTWGAGAKYYPSEKVGIRAGFRWTPANLGETADEWLCSPYWPVACAVSGDNTQYAHQYEISVGVVIRF